MRIVFFTLLACLLCISPPASAKEGYTVGITCYDIEKCRVPEVENVLREIYRRAGVEIHFAYLPRLRDLSDANDLAIDASSGRTMVAISRYENLVPVNIPLIRMSYIALTRQIIVRDNLTVSDALESVDVLHTVNKHYANLVPRLEKAIRSMQKDGTLQHLMGRLYELRPDPVE